MANNHNGHAALPPELLEPPSTEIECQIGEATAAAVVASCQALANFWAGGAMTVATRTANGETLAKMYELSLEADGLNFSATAHREGKRVLFARYGTWFRAQRGADIPEPMLDMLIDEVLEIVGKITAAERMLAH